MLYHLTGAILLCLFASIVVILRDELNRIHHTFELSLVLLKLLGLLRLRHYLLTSCALPVNKLYRAARYSSTQAKRNIDLNLVFRLFNSQSN